MDNSLANFELTESTVKVGTDSENGSDKSDEIVILDEENGIETNGDKSLNFDNNLPPTVTLLTHPTSGAKVYLVGTAHFSKESQEDVSLVIQTVKPNVVILELCKSRTNILSLDEATVLEEAKNIDSAKILRTIQENGLYNGIMYLLLLNMSAHLTKEIGMAPGGEFRVAYKEASKLEHCGIHLGDRPIHVTLKRALSRLTWFQTIKLAWHLLTAKDPVSIEDIERCKNRDMLEQLLADLAGEYPTFGEVFLEERDVYLTHSLQMAAVDKLRPSPKERNPNFKEPLKVVGVVGIGHMPGIVRLWPNDQSGKIEEIMHIPPPSLTSIAIRYTIRISLLSLGGYMIYKYVRVPKVVKTNLETAVHKFVSSFKPV
ncbi:traB domain-containing protein [Aethina tumida]|uniref:traB domain-containing protein n=1 Tax=Aethina tumida TaxID=116153 RepID=UPI00096AEBEA|nr:traB domain-containing protein [Aethina tumida]